MAPGLYLGCDSHGYGLGHMSLSGAYERRMSL
eukprot:CAMPEP_0114559784 /NCGR_PEP_ID=MMETSP0114-20121206/11103_1 /TAXON_ID=31324 /ORGANISM="Goniomonas sp, Strain m" /LENGTH=31 /DNA_ID= /DNA_START= /DNA_END= /DNA_ORIENTATION=